MRLVSGLRTLPHPPKFEGRVATSSFSLTCHSCVERKERVRVRDSECSITAKSNSNRFPPVRQSDPAGAPESARLGEERGCEGCPPPLANFPSLFCFCFFYPVFLRASFAHEACSFWGSKLGNSLLRTFKITIFVC